MKTWNSVRISGAVGVAVLLVGAWQASATIVWNMPVGLAGNDNNSSAGSYYEVGNEFSVNTAGNVNAVGMFDYQGNGFGTAFTVAIFKLTGSTWNEVSGTSYTFTDSNNALAPNSDERMYTLPTPVKLTAGTTYAIVAGGYVTSSDPYFNTQKSNAGTLTPTFNGVNGALTELAAERGVHVGSSDPGLTAWAGPGAASYTFSPWPYGAGTFAFTPVPEVATFGAAAIGLLGLVYIGRYARLRRTMKLA